MIKNYIILLIVVLAFSTSKTYSQTTLAKEDIAIIGVNTDNEDFTFLLRTDITTGTEIYFTDNEVNAAGNGLNDTNEGIVLFTADADYTCGTVIGYSSNNSEFSNVLGAFMFNNDGDELLSFQGFNDATDTWTAFLHASVDGAITLPAGFTAADIVNGTSDNREYNGNTNNPTWAELNNIANYTEGNNFSSINLTTISFTCFSPCTPTQSITSFSPTSGPVGTVVTIIGSGFSASSSVQFNGVLGTIISQSATELNVQVTSGTSSGAITVIESGCPLDSVLNFNILENSGTCNTSTFNDILITEVYDRNGQNNWYMELYNPTNTAVDLDALGTDFSIERYANVGGAIPSRIIDLSGTINPNSVFTLNLGNSADDCVFTADFVESGDGINDNDEIRLLKNGASIDVVEAPNNIGYSILRLGTAASGPSNIFNMGDWSISNTESCADIGTFNAPITNIPVVSAPILTNNCLDFEISINATASNAGALTYQWKYNDGISNIWLDVTALALNPATVSGETTDTLVVSGINLDGFQFYCEVTENTSCTVSSNAEQLSITTATWDGTNWVWNDGTLIDTLPDLSTNVVIEGSFSGASFSACSLTVNNGSILTVSNGFYIEVVNDVTVNDGRITTQSRGSFVQRGDDTAAGDFILNTNGNADVNKTTAVLNNTYDYTYWSSPVENITVAQGLTEANVNRTYTFNANNFLDTDGDGVDDNGNAWSSAARTDMMNPSQGFAAMHGAFGMGTNVAYSYNFEGVYNTGDITFSVPYNTSNADDHWNLIGNPYPSAIDANAFFAANVSLLDGVLYMWSHVSPPDADNNGNEVLNFNQSDYITVNTISTAGNGTTPPPASQVPSGQGFFISSNAAGAGLFTNSMRVSGDNTNNEFYRTSNTSSQSNTNDIERLWLNLSSEIGIYSQISIAYANSATDEYDGKHIDTERNYAGNAGFLYSLDNQGEGFYVIQGKGLNSLNEDESIKIGFGALISTNETYTIDAIKYEGDFLTSNIIYLKDNLLNLIHNLSASPYTFSSDGGIFDERFEIVFKNQALSIDDNTFNENDLIVIEQEDNLVKFELRNLSTTIETLKIYDLQGRLIYNFKGNSNAEIFNLSNLSQQVYVVKAKLSNGIELIKKSIKK